MFEQPYVSFFWKGWRRNAVYQWTNQGLGRFCQNIATVCIKALVYFFSKNKINFGWFSIPDMISILYFMLDVLLILFCSIHIILVISILTVVYVTFFAPELSFTWFSGLYWIDSFYLIHIILDTSTQVNSPCSFWPLWQAVYTRKTQMKPALMCHQSFPYNNSMKCWLATLNICQSCSMRATQRSKVTQSSTTGNNNDCHKNKFYGEI